MASNADDACCPNMSSYAARFNPPEDQREFTTVISQLPISNKRPAMKNGKIYSYKYNQVNLKVTRMET